MKTTKNVLVALDSTSLGESLQKHTALFVNKLGANSVLGIHIVPVLKIADSLTVDARNPLMPAAPAVELIRKQVDHQVDLLRQCCKKSKVGIAIREGQPFPIMVKLAKEMEADLLVMGRKRDSSNSGITAKKIARKVESDLLFVPNRKNTSIEHILVAVDFSENAARAVGKAIFLAAQLGIEKPITCLNILDIPPISRVGDLDIYNLAGKSILEISKERYDQFVKEYELDQDRLEPLFVESWETDLGSTIRSTAHETSADLVVIGAHGHNPLHRFFMGSVAENLVELDEDHLIWVVR